MNDTIMQSWGDAWPEVRATKPAGVIDESTFKTIEVDELFDAVNHCTTTIGQAVLYRSLAQPLDALDAIQEKQQAITELQKNAELAGDIESIVKMAAVDEKGLYQLFYGKFLGMFGTSREGEDEKVEGYGYEPYIKGTRLMLQLVAGVQSLQAPTSKYLLDIFKTITDFADTREHSLMEGPVYKTESALFCKKDKKFFIPALIFRPRIFKPLFITLCIGLLWLVGQFNPFESMDLGFEFSPGFFLFVLPLALLYIPAIGSYDRDSCIYPLRDEFKASPDVQKTLDALGQLDELLSFIKYAHAYGSKMTLPELIAGKHHRISLTDAKNPILGKANKAYVGNDFKLDKEKLVFITGPNSGGKTAFCKTITQIQVLAQAGCFVPAQSATMTVADKVFYQVPEISHLDDGEGRFGTELKRTKTIFLATTAKSLVILDELSEGTTFEEKLETSANVLNGFYQKGNSTILITHNHQLVDDFIGRGIGLAKQVEFAHDEPTFKLLEGISRVSHADRVAKKIGFSKDDIDSYLKNT
jgi:DNA mismatch repair protein MutS